MTKTVSEITKIKRRVYTSLARLALKDNLVEKIEALPELLLSSNLPGYRCCEYKEQAVLRERIKLALGFDPREHKHISLTELAKKMDQLEEAEQVIQVLEVACDHCPIDKYMVTDACRNCVAHSCVNACPKNAIVVVQNRAYIDQAKCIECGKCKKVCSFEAIHENNRPCARVCDVDAIKADVNRQASIDYDKCIGCGSCVVSCPFGAVGDSSRIVQIVRKLKDPTKNVRAILAPSFVGQFGAKIGPERVKAALKDIGFSHVYEAALGADMVALEEAHELVEKLEEGQSFMTSSCCPTFLNLINKHYPHLADHASTTVSPMIALARSLKREDPTGETVFIGPCITKKIEAKAMDSVDEVLTFEELGCILVSRGINLAEYELEEEVSDASGDGRNFAYAGGLRGVINDTLNELGKGDLAKTFQVDGVADCKKALKGLETGKLDYNFMEGMGCPGGCVGGPGTMMNSKVTASLVKRFAKKSKWKLALDNVKAEQLKDDLAESIERN